MHPNFNDTNLPEWLDSHQGSDFDQMSYGIVQMNHEGVITAYNKFESDLTGVSKENAIGKHFFTEVAPCTNNFMVAEKYKQDLLDEVMPYMFTYITAPTPVELRLIKRNNGHQYLLAKNA